MKNMKRILALLLSLVLVLTLCACEFNADDLTAALKDKADQVVDDLKDQAIDVAGNAIQGVADSMKDKVEDIIGGNSESDETTITSGGLTITMLDVDQGLAVLFESNGKYMLYDGGDRATSSYVVSYLDKHGVDELEYMVASHYDADHIAGLVGVLETTEVNAVINPAYKVTTKIYESYIKGVQQSGAEVIYPDVGDKYKLGDATIVVLAPAKDYGDSNEMSVAMKITCGDFACVITGDAETKSENDMLNSGINLNADLYVVGHHGSSSSSSKKFVKAIDPDYAFISCGKDNDYGHPHAETLEVLSSYTSKIYRTDKNGEVKCTYKNGKITID